MVGKAPKSHGARCELNSVFSLEKMDRWNTIRTSAIRSRGSEKRHESLRLEGFQNRESNPGASEYKAGTLATQSLRYSVVIIIIIIIIIIVVVVVVVFQKL
jgi:hypothetical protein